MHAVGSIAANPSHSINLCLIPSHCRYARHTANTTRWCSRLLVWTRPSYSASRHQQCAATSKHLHQQPTHCSRRAAIAAHVHAEQQAVRPSAYSVPDPSAAVVRFPVPCSAVVGPGWPWPILTFTCVMWKLTFQVPKSEAEIDCYGRGLCAAATCRSEYRAIASSECTLAGRHCSSPAAGCNGASARTWE